MAFVRGKSTLDTPGVNTNIGKEKREQDESRQHASDVNKGLAESGVSFDSRTQVVDASGYSNARRPYDQYIRENPLAGTIAGQVDVVVNNYSPKVRVNDAGTGLVLSGTKTALESDYAKELRSFLADALQYQDLKSQNVADAIEKINNDIRQQIERSVVEGGLKTNYDTYKDYAHALEVTTSTNPMKKAGDKNKIFGLLKDGTVDYKTPKDWEDYYRKNYSTADRANLYKNALARYKDFSSGAIDDATEIDLALITPYLVMSGGGRANETNAGMPIYGFDTGERLGALGESFLNEIGRLIEGGARAVWETVAPALNLGRYKASRVRDISSVFGVDSVDSEQIPWESEENYTNRINSLIGKNVNELTDDEKVFMAASFTLNPMGDWGETDKSYAENVLDYITDDNGEITEDINRVTGYDSYIHSRDSLSTTEKYTKEVEERSEQLASGRDWLQERVDAASVYAPISSSLGAMAGTLMRMWAESVIISTATGGVIAPASISDVIADGIKNILKKATASSMTATTMLQTLQHPVGKFILSVVAELPEDVVQTVIDDVMTGRAEDIVQLAPTGDANKDMEKLGESFAQNLAFRLAFTPIHAGAKTFKDWRAARTAAKASGVDKTVPADVFEKNQKLREAADSGSIIDVDANSATVRNPDGTEEVLDNVAMLHFAPDSELAERYPGIAEMLRKKGLVSDAYDVDISQKIDAARKAVDDGEFEDVSTGIIKKGLRYDEDGELVDLSGNKIELENDADSTVIYRGQPFDENGTLRFNYKSFENGLRDNAFHFMTKPDYAANFGDSLIYSRVKNDSILVLSDFEDIKSLASFYANNIDELAGYAERNGLEKAQLLQRIDSGDIRAIAEFSQKPIISIYSDDSLGTEEVYFPGIDEDFDKSLSATTLASSTPDAPIASEANIKMAEDIQKALDSSPYDRTIKEIVADKYATSNIAEAPNSSSYRWESPDVTKTYNTEAEVFADMPTGKNLTEVRQWEKNAHSFYMNRYMQETMPEFTEKYPTVDEQQQFVRNMDYLFDLQRIDGETIESAVGRTFENEGIVYTVSQDDIDFYQNYVEPQMKGLREAGAAAIGKEAFTITGYLPHSDYDPTILTAEDSMQQGVLWREYTGASTTDDDGNFSTGWLNPDLTARYSTFVHNMLWDSLGDNVVVAKYMEEFNADGLNVAANTVEKMVGGRKRLAHLVSESDSVKAVVKNLLGDGELPTEAQLEKAAKDLGSTDIVHDLYRPVYGEAKGLYQTKSATSVKLMSKSDWMRSLATGDGTLYDNGGAMIVNGAADAKFLAKRITDAINNGGELDVHQMFVEYLMQNQRRTAKGANYIADKWMNKIAQKASNGGISRRALTAELGSLIYGEGANRLFRFIGRMDTSQLTSANKQALDSLLFRHSALSKIKNTSGISAQINKWTNRLISARMKSLFWLNYKNAVLQASECVRLFTEFKFGDARATIKRLATDADFRATVDEWVDMLVPERFVKSDSTAATGALDMVAEKTSFKNGEMTVSKFSADDIRKFGEKIDEFGRAPVELGETMKNRVMMAGILQEAERKGLTGNELFNYVNQRFERVGLAANEMGRLNASDSPLFRLGANLKTFQIRQFRMFLNNIHDMNGAGEAATYIIKNLGWKLGLALIMGKLGYSTAATLGLDPFDLMDDDYTGVDEENYAGLDYAMLSPVAKLFLSGGFTGYINDAYWAARKAYEDNATITEQTENKAGDNIWPGLAMPGMSFDNVFDAFSGFIPGFTAGKRVYQMNELLETGWATSASGNKMYEAPNNPFDITTGYLFGRSNTPNARAYYQNPDYLQGLLENGLPGVAQQFGREFGGFRQFDPIDRQNYSDWFNGTAADEQQWNSGYYYFLNKVNDITDKYQNSLSGYVDDAQREELSLSYNRQIAEIEDQLNKFTAAYEAKHPDGIDANKMRNLVNVLNIYEPVLNENEADALERRRKAYNDALYRYTQAGLPAVTSYERGDEGVEAVYSPQVRAALQGRYGLPEEAAQRVKELYNDKWKKLNQQYRDRYYDTKGSKQKKAIQEEYINIVRQDLDPIVSLYGSEIFSNDTVEDIVEDVFNSMIPKYGQTAKSYLKNAYKNYHGTINYAESGNTTLSEINNLLDQGKTARAKALARTLLQRVQENRTSLTRQEMERLQAILND